MTNAASARVSRFTVPLVQGVRWAVFALVCHMVANRRWLKALSEELHATVLRSFADAAVFGARNAVEWTRFCTAQFTEKHREEILYADDEKLPAFRQAAGPIRQMYVGRYRRTWRDLVESAIAEAVGELKSTPLP